MKTIRLLIVAMAFISHSAISFAQQKYAVLITGDYAGMSYSVPLSDQWNGGQGKSANGFDEFWNDTFLMWEMLQTIGYSQENIFVLFANGQDYYLSDPNVALRYRPIDNIVTDYSASIANVTNVFNGLHNGTGGFPQVTNDDFLFVWTFDHGGGSSGNSILYLIDGGMTDDQFAALVNPITANKKVYWMQQCRSGGFADELESNNVVFHAACQPSQNAYRADNSPYSENEIINGQIYNHGEFNFHIYSSTNGSSPAYYTSYGNESYTAADVNSDNCISITESYSWEAGHESIINEIPLFSDIGNIGAITSLEYPTLLHTDISNSVVHRGLIGISKDVHVLPGKQLTIAPNADVYLLNNAKLIIDAGSTLVIQNGAQIFGSYNNSIQVNGNIQIGQDVTFTRSGYSDSFGGLSLNNNALQTTLTGITFDRSGFNNYGANLTMSNCSFINCNWVYSHRGNVTINNSNLTETWFYLENQANDPNLTAMVSGCTIANTNMHVGIDVWNYGNYFIENNNIRAYHNGIQINNSGYGNSGNQNITLNYIHDCGESGIMAYNVTGLIEGNNIRNNRYGVKLMNNCNIALLGNSSAQTYSQTQQISDNSSYEVYASKFSFPWYFRYNAIIDENNLGNPSDPLVFYDNPNIPYYYKIDVQYNCWGNNFNPGQDLKTYSGAIWKWSPTWCPSRGVPPDDPIEDMYKSAVEQFEDGYYSNAINLFKLLIHLYPKSDYSQSAMKELLRLEEYATSDFSSLKDYYLTNDSIVADTQLVKLGNKLANQCDIKLGNWPQAISWFENEIANPTCLEDSIFAIIDLGYTYFLMENQGLKTTYVGNMIQFKPETKEKYFEHRDYLLSLLPGEVMSNKLCNDLTQLSYGSLLQNVPNPFTESTQIWYKVEKRVDVCISITELTGKEIDKIEQGTKDKGTYKIDFVNSSLTPGTYFYSLILDGKNSDTRKMIIIR